MMWKRDKYYFTMTISKIFIIVLLAFSPFVRNNAAAFGYDEYSFKNVGVKELIITRDNYTGLYRYEIRDVPSAEVPPVSYIRIVYKKLLGRKIPTNMIQYIYIRLKGSLHRYDGFQLGRERDSWSAVENTKSMAKPIVMEGGPLVSFLYSEYGDYHFSREIFEKMVFEYKIDPYCIQVDGKIYVFNSLGYEINI